MLSFRIRYSGAFGGIIPSPREPYPYLIEDLGIAPEPGHRESSTEDIPRAL